MGGFKELFRRRVPQIVALYIAASWGVVQFVDFLVERYALSPYLVDVVLLAAVLLLPSVLLVSWQHGAPGRDTVGLAEKVGVPTNLILAVVVLGFFVSGKDLGAVTTTVTVTDEEGVTSERVVAKSEFRKRINLYFFDAPADDTASAWLQYGLPWAVATDLVQDQFMDTRFPIAFADRLREAGYERLNGLPLPLAREIAREQHRDQFVMGTVARIDGEIRATVSLHDARRGRLIQEREYTGSDVLEIADRISAQLRADLEVPAIHLEGMEDLPVADILTHEPEAYRAFIEAQRKLQVERDFEGGFALMKRAAEIDPTYADAQRGISAIMAYTGQGGSDFSAMQAAMDHAYRLPERLRFAVKSDYYFLVRQDAEKAFAVIDMWADLFPDDITAYLALVQVQTVRNDLTGVISSLEKVLELDPSQSAVLLQLGGAYESNGDLDAARRSYELYADQYPDDHRGLTQLAGLARRTGDLEGARDFWERATLLEPSNVGLIVGMARAEQAVGNFDAALREYESALDAARTPDERVNALQGLEQYYARRGRIGQAIEFMEQRLAESVTFLPALQVASQRMNTAVRYVQAGRVDQARAALETAKAEMPDAFRDLNTLGDLGLSLALEDPDLIEASIPALEKVIEQSQYDMFQPRVAFARGRVHELRGEFAEALAMYEEERSLSPGEESIPGQIARCLRGLGEYDQAAALFEERLAVAPYSPTLNYELALTYEAMGREDDARRHLERALEVWQDADPGYKDAQEAREALQRLGA